MIAKLDPLGAALSISKFLGGKNLAKRTSEKYFYVFRKKKLGEKDFRKVFLSLWEKKLSEKDFRKVFLSF